MEENVAKSNQLPPYHSFLSCFVSITNSTNKVLRTTENNRKKTN